MAQIVDMFDQSTWYLIFGIGWGAPLLAILAAAIWLRRVEAAAVAAAILYYMIVLGGWLSATDTIISAAVVFGTLFCGPVLAIVIVFIHWRARRSDPNEQRPTHGFPIEPLSQDSDIHSN